jgi:hypothetical protein
MKEQTFWPLPILAGLVLGVTLGLIFAWLIAPVQYHDTAPDRLRADLKEEYVLLICETYAADGDWAETQERLVELGDPDIGATIMEMAERAIEQGRPVSTIRHLAAVANRYGVTSPAVARFMPTVPPTPSPSPAAERATPTPTRPLLPTATRTPTPTASPTRSAAGRATYTPQPTATPALLYRLTAQERICDADRPDPLLQVVVLHDDEEVGGVEVVVTWRSESARLFTGFKPELGAGYADMIMESNTPYAVQLAAGSDEVSGVQTAPCTSEAGPRLVSVRLVFEKVGTD